MKTALETSKINMPKHALVTGATGFVGRLLCDKLHNYGINVSGTLLPSESSTRIEKYVTPVLIKPLGTGESYRHCLINKDVLIHLAARVHVMQETATDPLQEFRTVNLNGTEQLARQAAQAGVKRFVFMSTIGVNGDNSGDKPFAEGDVPHPHNPYSVSKYEAELALIDIFMQTGMEVVILRAPLVYGPGNPGNFLSLLNIISKKIPLPLASITNRRSLIYAGNLVDALITCATHQGAAGKTYLVCDSEDISTPDLIRRTASALGVPARLLPFPASLIRLTGKLTGNSGAVNQLIGSLTVDSTKIRRDLGWKPPFTMEEGLKETAGWFKRDYLSMART